jgi:hypothetical protein
MKSFKLMVVIFSLGSFYIYSGAPTQQYLHFNLFKYPRLYRINPRNVRSIEHYINNALEEILLFKEDMIKEARLEPETYNPLETVASINELEHDLNSVIIEVKRAIKNNDISPTTREKMNLIKAIDRVEHELFTSSSRPPRH